MGTRLFVGNVSYGTTEESLRGHFEEKGWVVSDAVIVTDRETGRSRGFGFVEVGGDGEAERFKETLDGDELDGRRLTIREAFERTPRHNERRRPRVEVEHVGRGGGSVVAVGDDQESRPPRQDVAFNEQAGRDDRKSRGGRHSGGRHGRRTRDNWQDEDGW